LGAYYWLHWVSQLPGGLLARRYGTKLVFGLANLLTALLGFFIPYVTHLYVLVTLRMLQGLIAVNFLKIPFLIRANSDLFLELLHRTSREILLIFSFFIFASGCYMAFDA